MSGLETVIDFVMELSLQGLALAVWAAMYAGLFAGVVLVINLVARRWITAAQMNLLWGLVLLRLLMPLAPPTALSLQNLFATTEAATGGQSAVRSSQVIYTKPGDSEASMYGGHSELAKTPAAVEPAVTTLISTENSWEDVICSLLAFLLIGGAAMFVWTVIINWRFARRVKVAPLCNDQRILDLWKACRHQARVRKSIPIMQFDGLQQPAVMGLFRIKLLLPSNVMTLDDNQLRMIMFHELAHVRRRDIPFNWIMVVIRAFHWWNPVYWLAATRFCSLREQACDAFVMRRMESETRHSYGELLLTLAQREPLGPSWRVMLPASILGFFSSFFRKRAIRNRLQALRGAGSSPSRWRTAVVSAMIVLAAICGLTDAKVPVPETLNTPDDWLPRVIVGTRLNAVYEQDQGSVETRTYDVAEVLDRIAVDHFLSQGPSKELEWQIGNILRSKPIANHLQPKDQEKFRDDSASPQNSYFLDGTLLTVQACTSVHNELEESLKAWKLSGLGQINVECRLWESDHDMVSSSGASWQYFEAFSADREQTLSSERSDGMPVVSATAGVDAYLPVVVTTLSDPQTCALMRAAQSDRKASFLQAPKVTLFNGQHASIIDVSQTPFVVGLRQVDVNTLKPKIAVLDEGTKLTLRLVHSSDDRRQVHLKGRIELSQIVEVNTVAAVFHGESTTIQIPRLQRCRIDVDCEVEDGQSVLIGCIPAYEKKRFFYTLLTVRNIPDSEMKEN